ncbi:MAG: hypothetical protein IKI97_10105, partial [Clostridia bacterium]|nr:hypothetical protein [Clostridia bacterium]
MSHINITVPRLSADKTTLLKCGKFDKGVAFCQYDRELYDGQSPFVKNMIYEKNMLRTRFGQYSVEIGDLPEGKLHSVCTDMFFKKYVFHIGGALYSFDGSELCLLSDEIPDCDSFVFEMNSTLYFFCSKVRIFMVKKDFSVSEQEIKEVNVGYDAKYNLSTYTKVEPPDNMLMFRGNIVYFGRDAGIKYYTLPTEPDTDYEVIFTSLVDGKVKTIPYTIDGNTVNIKNEQYSSFRVSYVPAKGSE